MPRILTHSVRIGRHFRKNEVSGGKIQGKLATCIDRRSRGWSNARYPRTGRGNKRRSRTSAVKTKRRVVYIVAGGDNVPVVTIAGRIGGNIRNHYIPDNERRV